MDLKVSNRQEMIKLGLVTMIAGFMVAFLSAPFILNEVFGSGGPTFDDKLRNLDAALDHAVNTCSKDIFPSTKQSCLDKLEESWWIECSEFYDKLDTCKNGKIENFLKENGRPT